MIELLVLVKRVPIVADAHDHGSDGRGDAAELLCEGVGTRSERALVLGDLLERNLSADGRRQRRAATANIASM